MWWKLAPQVRHLWLLSVFAFARIHISGIWATRQSVLTFIIPVAPFPHEVGSPSHCLHHWSCWVFLPSFNFSTHNATSEPAGIEPADSCIKVESAACTASYGRPCKHWLPSAKKWLKLILFWCVFYEHFANQILINSPSKIIQEQLMSDWSENDFNCLGDE